jgi:hypothetical protein
MPGGYHNQARMTINSSGAGAFSLSGAVAPFNTFANAGVVNGEVVPYGAIDTGTGNAEQGWGVYTTTGSTTGGPALTRNPFIVTGGGTTPFAAASATTQVFIDPSVADFVQLSLMAQANLGGL